MRKVLSIFIFIAISSASHAQLFSIGANGIFNSTWLFNKFDDTPSISRETVTTFGMAGGLDIKYYFNNNSYYNDNVIAVSFNPSMRSIKQKFKGTITVTDTTTKKSHSYNEEFKLSYIELPLMIHFQGEAGLYAELGASYGLIQSAKASFSTEDTAFVTFSDLDVKSSFTSSNISGIFGFGIASNITDQLTLTTGLRFTYGLGDINSSAAKSAGANPTRTGTGGFVLGLAYKFDSYYSR